jgi:hypothetical protein
MTTPTNQHKENTMTTPTTISIDGTDYVRADSIPLPVPTPDAPDGDGLAPLLGHAVFVRTVTMHYTGRVVAITADSIALDDAAWIADSGRFYGALKAGVLSEVEPFPSRVWVARGALVDITTWDHDLPREQK